MNHKFKGLKVIIAPAVLALVAGTAMAGCSEATDGTGGLPGIDCELQGRIDALTASVNALTAVEAEMRTSVAAACAGITGDMAPADPTSDDVTMLCDAASAEITAQFMAAGDVSVAIAP